MSVQSGGAGDEGGWHEGDFQGNRFPWGWGTGRNTDRFTEVLLHVMICNNVFHGKGMSSHSSFFRSL